MLKAHRLHIASFVNKAVLFNDLLWNFHNPQVGRLHMTFKQGRFAGTNLRSYRCSRKSRGQRYNNQHRLGINVATTILVGSIHIYVIGTRLKVGNESIHTSATGLMTAMLVNPTPSPIKVFVRLMIAVGRIIVWEHTICRNLKWRI